MQWCPLPMVNAVVDYVILMTFVWLLCRVHHSPLTFCLIVQPCCNQGQVLYSQSISNYINASDTVPYGSYLSKIGSPNSRCLFFSCRSFRITFFRADGLFLADVSRSLPRLTSGAVESNMLCGMWATIA